MTRLQRMKRWLKGERSAAAGPVQAAELERIARDLAAQEARLQDLWLSERGPRIALVKQDVCEDLYCGTAEDTPRALVESTQLRSGPVSLLQDARARFHVLQTMDDPECQIWKERATSLRWDTVEFFASYRDRIPGRNYGQSKFAVPPDAVDWSQYDLVISIDVAVPQSITRRYPATVWAYYVREIKAPSYRQGLQHPAAGQDLFLNHCFRLHPPPLPAHVVEFPYHLQRPGCFHELFEVPLEQPREGIFVDHHTLIGMSEEEMRGLGSLGPVNGPVLPATQRYEAGKSVPPRRTMDPDLRNFLLAAKYFVMASGQRRVHGTALVEAVAAGCLAIGSPASMPMHGFLFSPATTAENLQQVFQRIRFFERHPEAYAAEFQRQRLLIQWLCYVRPCLALFEQAATVRHTRLRTPS